MEENRHKIEWRLFVCFQPAPPFLVLLQHFPLQPNLSFGALTFNFNRNPLTRARYFLLSLFSIPPNNNFERVYQNLIILQLVLEVKDRLEKEHYTLPIGRNGRDDEDMILWFLKDRKFSVQEAVSKLAKTIVSFFS